MTMTRHVRRAPVIAMRRGSRQGIPQLASAFCEALQVGSIVLAERRIDDALMAGVSPTEVHALIIEPAMVRIGELWQSGTVSVADEHLATAISHRVLIRLVDALTTAGARSRERVVLAAVQGQRHVLGLCMIADVLEGAGFDVLFLGDDVPNEALGGFVTEHQPAVIGLSFPWGDDVSSLRGAIEALHGAGASPLIMLGGAAVPVDLRNREFPWVRSSLEVTATVEALLARTPQTMRAPNRGPGRSRGSRRREPSPTALTPRELEVLQLSATGQHRRQIADELSLTEGTVKTHLEHIYKKLGVHDRTSAVGQALRQGLIH